MKKSPEERIATPDQLLDLRNQSVAQIIYEDNRVRATFTSTNGFFAVCCSQLTAPSLAVCRRPQGVTGRLADTPTRGLDNWRTSHLADWTTRGLTDAAKGTKTKHTKSLVASASCPVRDLSSTQVV